jgi:hypothetical protein
VAEPDASVGTNELAIIDGTGQSLVPARRLILTRAPEYLLIPNLQAEVSKFETITLENHDRATATLKNLRVTRKKVETFHEAQKGPINEVRGRALDLEKSDVNAIKSLETTLGARLLAFDQEVEKKRKDEEERLNREALAKAQAEADARAKALRDAAKAEDDLKVKRQLNSQARALKDAPVFVAPVKVSSTISTVSTVERWSAEILDVMSLVRAVAEGRVPLAALEPEQLIGNHPWLNSQAVQGREEFTLPGVVAVKKTSLSGR